MSPDSVLIIDDEKNIRLTMKQTIEEMGLLVKTAVNGEEALQIADSTDISVVFLDLKLPGMNGLEVLKVLSRLQPHARVVIITAHGTIESAVEAMKLGAADFLQKPFSPNEIRQVLVDLARRSEINEPEECADQSLDYPCLIQLAKKRIGEKLFSQAIDFVKKAIGADPSKPESYNLLGILQEINGEWVEAQKFYRAALDIDPTYKPAASNLERTATWNWGSLKPGNLDIGDLPSDSDRDAS